MSTYYVYELWNPIKNQPFYVGKGTKQGARYPRYHYHIAGAMGRMHEEHPNTHKNNTILKIIREGYEVIEKVVFETAIEEDAYGREVELIKTYGRRDLRTGILTNRTNGGERLSGEDNPMYGRNHSEETRQRISQLRIDRFQSGDIIPTKHSEEHKQRLREDNKGGQATAKPIYQICKDTGMVLNVFSSGQAAAEALNANKGNLCAAATRFKTRLVLGYYWRYVDDQDVQDDRLVTFDRLKQIQSRHRAQYVHQYDLNGNYIKTWNTQREVCAFYNYDESTFSSYVSEGKPLGEFHWTRSRYKEPVYPDTTKQFQRGKNYVHQYDLNGNYIKTWDSQVDVYNFTKRSKSMVSRCMDLNLPVEGFYWTRSKTKDPIPPAL